MTNNTNQAGVLGTTDRTCWSAETACWGEADGGCYAGEDSKGLPIKIDLATTHQIDGREGRWLPGKLFGGVPAAGGSANFVANVLASNGTCVEGELVFPERGRFQFAGNLMQMAKALFDGGKYGLFGDARLDARRD